MGLHLVVDKLRVITTFYFEIVIYVYSSIIFEQAFYSFFLVIMLLK